MLVPDAQVFQLEGFPEKDLSDLGFWDRYCCPGIPRTLHEPGKSLGWDWKGRAVPSPGVKGLLHASEEKVGRWRWAVRTEPSKASKLRNGCRHVL